MSSKCDFVFLYCFWSKRRKLKQSYVVYVTELTSVLLIEQIEQFPYVNKCLWS